MPPSPGEIPDLFSEEEAEGIVSALRAEVRASGLLDSKENCWRFFTDRVRQQLTVRPFTVLLLETSFFCPCNSLRFRPYNQRLEWTKKIRTNKAVVLAFHSFSSYKKGKKYYIWLKDCVEKHVIVNCLNRSAIFKSPQLKTKSTISLVLQALWFFCPHELTLTSTHHPLKQQN